MAASVSKMWPGLGWLTGPIFGKELRVSARRKRNFWLRFLYVLLMTIFITVVWVSVVEYQSNSALQQSRTAAAGKEIVTTTVLFQFIAVQVLAVIMLSTAISDEVYHRTLGLLMTTPISGLQIVMGKVLSKLLQLLLLLGITLPILAIVRVFGGVSLDYLLSSLCVTLTAVLLAGAVSLLFSIGDRRAYAVIARAVVVLASFYLVLPAVILTLSPASPIPAFANPGRSPSATSVRIFSVLAHLNPFYAISALTERMLSPGRAQGFYWPVHCAIMLGLSALVLAWAVKVVRRVALRQATGQLDISGKSWKTRHKRRRRAATAPADSTVEGPVKRVLGPPVIWKELRAPFIQGVDNRNSYIGLVVTVLALAVTYWVSAREGVLDENFAQTSYALLFILLGIVFTVVLSATRITTERESQTWLLLLATPLADGDILLGKAFSSFRRCLPIWGLLGGHMVLFVAVGYIHYVALAQILILVVWLACFVTAVGLYFSTRLTRTTSAVVASFGLIVGLWVVLPVLLSMLAAVGKGVHTLGDLALFHPVLQTQMIMAGASGVENAELPLRSLRYTGPMGTTTAGGMTKILLGTAAVYLVAASLLFWRAKSRLRRHVF